MALFLRIRYPLASRAQLPPNLPHVSPHDTCNPSQDEHRPQTSTPTFQRPSPTPPPSRRPQLRRVVSSLKRRMRDDFNLDEATAARLALGLGDGSMPALSVFGPPIIDFGGASAAAQQAHAVSMDAMA